MALKQLLLVDEAVQKVAANLKVDLIFLCGPLCFLCDPLHCTELVEVCNNNLENNTELHRVDTEYHRDFLDSLV